MFITIKDTQYRLTKKPIAPDSYTTKLEVEKEVNGSWKEIEKREMKEIWSKLQEEGVV